LNMTLGSLTWRSARRSAINSPARSSASGWTKLDSPIGPTSLFWFERVGEATRRPRNRGCRRLLRRPAACRQRERSRAESSHGRCPCSSPEAGSRSGRHPYRNRQGRRRRAALARFGPDASARVPFRRVPAADETEASSPPFARSRFRLRGGISPAARTAGVSLRRPREQVRARPVIAGGNGALCWRLRLTVPPLSETLALAGVSPFVGLTCRLRVGDSRPGALTRFRSFRVDARS
jgi:hypothetical protein